jgi:hypothetical protein
MNIKILSQNIVNNPKDFTAEEIEKYFEDYYKFRVSNFTQNKLKVEEVAETYHDKLCGNSTTVREQICPCCWNLVTTTTKIEHDSQDYSKDLSVCFDCYSKIHTQWQKNNPAKISPI